MSEIGVKVAKRKFYQKYLTDPLFGVLVIFLWKLFQVLPVDTASAIGGHLGTFFSFFLREKNKTALYNLQKCFPEKSEEERRLIAKKMWRHCGSIMGEMPHARSLEKRIQIEGMEYVNQMKNDGIGGFIASGHLGNWELCGPIALQMGVPLHIVYRAANNPWVEKFVFSYRRTKGVQLIPKGTAGARKMIELLRAGEHIGILCDQKLREGIDVPFFGYPTKTAPAIATLALKYKLLIVPTQVIRLKGAHYKCIFHKPMDLPDTGDKTKDTLIVMTKINQMLEDWIRQNPEQWLWIHHRWDKKEYLK